MTDNGHDFCCSGLTDLRRAVRDHTSDGPSHGVIAEQIANVREDVLALKLSLETETGRLRMDIERVEGALQKNQLKLYGFMGGVGTLTTVLSLLGPERIGRVFAVVGSVLAGGWNG